ncbi:MAG TPA: zinc ribbon domain-containing protein [Methanoregula sp.]|nr:zinc ribbon domain-containing protein [Methanoregula sp.]
MTRGLKFCTECGTTLAPGMRFCGHCGHSVPCAVTPAGYRMGKDNGATGTWWE